MRAGIERLLLDRLTHQNMDDGCQLKEGISVNVMALNVCHSPNILYLSCSPRPWMILSRLFMGCVVTVHWGLRLRGVSIVVPPYTSMVRLL